MGQKGEDASRLGGSATISRRKFLRGAAAGASALALGTWNKRIFAQVRNPVKIGISLPLTGGMTEPGRNMMLGYELWAETVNARGGLLGRPVELVIEDNRTNTEVAVSQYERLINVENVDLLFSTFSSLLTFPTSAVAERYEMVYPIVAGGARNIYERGFKYCFYFQQELAEDIADGYFNVLAGYGVRPFPRTVGLTHVNDFFANALASGVPAQVEEHQMQLVHSEQFPFQTTDYLSVVNPLRRINPDFWMAPVAGAQDGINLIRAAITIGYNPLGVGMSTAPAQPEFKDVLGDAVNGVLFHSAWHPRVQYAGTHVSNQEFIELFRRKHGDLIMSEDHAIPFAAAQGMQYAVEQTGTLENRVLREFLASRTAADPVPTILGNFHWDERGAPLDMDFLMLQWIDGNPELVWPQDPAVKTADLLWPKPRW